MRPASPDTLLITLRFISSMMEVPAAHWNALVDADYPFLRHEFLLALEQSGCTTAATGWQPMHLLAEAEGVSGTELTLVACMPLYLKTNSMGEYVFDWSWADAYSRYGLDYYPKLVSAIPFTPCAGPRVMMAEGLDPAVLVEQIKAGVQAQARLIGASGWHVLFPDSLQLALFETRGQVKRTGCQYQWFNAGYPDFAAYLDTFASRKRKNLRKEREKVAAAGISFQVLEGLEVSEQQWETFYRFYASTYQVRGRAPYLNREFFKMLGKQLPDQLLLILASDADAPIAGALFFKGTETLYGRYWGCSTEYQFLHFETCYYQGIDYCIQHGINRIDSGAQGEHKIQRGFTPVPTWSVHWLARPDFHKAIAGFVKEEERYILDYVAQASEHLPFRKDQPVLELDVPDSAVPAARTSSGKAD